MKAKKLNYSRIFRKYLPVSLFIGTLFALIFVHYQYSPASIARREAALAVNATPRPKGLRIPTGNPPTIAPTPVPTILTKDASVQVGGFRITVPANTAYGYGVGDKDILSEVSKVDDNCPRVGGMHRAWYRVRTPGRDADGSIHYSWQSWSPDQLTFADASVRRDYERRMNNMEQLFSAPDGNLEVASGKEFAYSCGAWFYPVYKKSYHQTGFDKVMYVEVNSGNGDPFGSPVKYLVVSHNGNIVLAAEFPIVDTESVMYDELMFCMNNQGPNATLGTGISCVQTIWGKYRTHAEVDAWVNQALSQID